MSSKIGSSEHRRLAFTRVDFLENIIMLPCEFGKHRIFTGPVFCTELREEGNGMEGKRFRMMLCTIYIFQAATMFWKFPVISKQNHKGVDESALPITMKVDYVRVFQKK